MKNTDEIIEKARIHLNKIHPEDRRQARDPVNQPMIRRWCEAMGETNPIYFNEEVAKENGFPSVVSPPAMLDVWTMEAYNANVERVGDHRIFSLLEESGYTRIVATNVEQEYDRYLMPGDTVSMTVWVKDLSDRKKTSLGVGYFVTLHYEFEDQNREPVGRMDFRLFKFKPGAKDKNQSLADKVQNAVPNAPIMTHDTEYYWKGLNEKKILIQQCSKCNELRHPPSPMCPFCHSMEWETKVSSCRGKVHSFAILHEPKLPGFDYPLPVVLVDLEEGVRLLANLEFEEGKEVEIGMDVCARFKEVSTDFTLPIFYKV